MFNVKCTRYLIYKLTLYDKWKTYSNQWVEGRKKMVIIIQGCFKAPKPSVMAYTAFKRNSTIQKKYSPNEKTY